MRDYFISKIKVKDEEVVITGKVSLDTSNSPFCFNTPHLPFYQYTETGNTKLMKQKHVDVLHCLKKEAGAYLAGKRSQLSLNI